jgi:hypothetical protein
MMAVVINPSLVSGFRVRVLGFVVSGFRVWGLGLSLRGALPVGRCSLGFRVWGRGFWGFIPLRGLTFLPCHAKDVIECGSGFKVEDDSVHRYSLSFPVRNMLAASNVMKWLENPSHVGNN